jgi:murein DD-endopeptidase MepM/ murein hydrolase activator NlpD
MSFPDPSRPGAHDEPSVLELLGFGTPTVKGTPVPTDQTFYPSNVPPQARPVAPAQGASAQHGSRRAQRESERRPQSGSAARRIRAIEKAHKKAARKMPKGARVAVATTSASRPARGGSSRARTVGSRILSFSAMIFAGALAVGMSVPANAFNSGGGGGSAGVATLAADKAQPEGTQSLSVDASIEKTSAARDEYSVTSWAEMLRLQYGTRDYNYSLGDPNGPIRWPFPYAVPISSGYGERAAPCYGCSSMHMGVDFTPGVGTPIYAIADGVVTTSLADQWGFGTHVIITHSINGQTVTSTYAHMQAGSTALAVGDQVGVGDFIGTVGMTGTATGNHLHLEITVDGTNVDPFAWLQANT